MLSVALGRRGRRGSADESGGSTVNCVEKSEAPAGSYSPFPRDVRAPRQGGGWRVERVPPRREVTRIPANGLATQRRGGSFSVLGQSIHRWVQAKAMQ